MTGIFMSAAKKLTNSDSSASDVPPLESPIREPLFELLRSLHEHCLKHFPALSPPTEKLLYYGPLFSGTGATGISKITYHVNEGNSNVACIVLGTLYLFLTFNTLISYVASVSQCACPCTFLPRVG